MSNKREKNDLAEKWSDAGTMAKTGAKAATNLIRDVSGGKKLAVALADAMHEVQNQGELLERRRSR